MFAALRRLLLVVACAIVGVVALPPVTPAQQTLQIDLFESPFVCDAIVRPLGVVSGFIPGEAVEFSAPELNGVFSRRVADSSGHVEMQWNCDAPQSWALTVRGLVSGSSSSFSLSGSAAPAPADAPIGAAFDAKSAMTAEQMAIWKDFSPFDTVGVYIGVNSEWDNRADKVQSNLTAPWVNQIFADGWSLIPIYVGFQAPDECATASYYGLSSNPATARNEGLASAADAVDSMARLGIGPGNPIYYDMEAYRPGCSEAVLSFLDAWTEGVHSAGYLSGVYGSRSSTMWDLSRALGRAGFDAPDAVWVSTGNGRPESFGLEIPSDGQWANARLHQYRLNITRTYGGVTRQIDENVGTAPLAAPGQTAPTTPTGPVTTTSDQDGDGITDPQPDNCDLVANPDQADQDGDGDGDVCDRDIDGDGVDNVSDFAPTDPTISAAPEAEPDPTAVPTATVSDVDGDGLADPEPDNCDVIANPDQSDIDNDGHGDVCDVDIDGDGVPNVADQEPRDPFIGALPTPAPDPVEPDPTPEATPEPTAEPEPTPAEPAPDATTEPSPTPEATEAPQVIVLPTPLPTETPPPTATPLPTAAALATDASALPGAQDGPTPNDGIEQAAETVTISVDDETSLLPLGVAALGSFSLFCVGMGIRSFRRTRTPVLL